MFQLGFYSRGVMRKWEADVQAGPESRAAPPTGGTVSQGTAPTPPESKTERGGKRGTRENSLLEPGQFFFLSGPVSKCFWLKYEKLDIARDYKRLKEHLIC